MQKLSVMELRNVVGGKLLYTRKSPILVDPASKGERLALAAAVYLKF